MRRNVSRRDYALASAPAGVSQGEQASLDLFRKASALLVAASIAIAVVLGASSDVRIDPVGFAPIAWVAAALLIVGIMLRSGQGQSRIADTLSTLGLVWASAMSCGAIAMLSLRLQLPMADRLLLAADHAIGVDAVSVVGWLVRRGQWIFSIMAPAYSYTISLLLLSMAALALTRRRLEAWRAAFCFIGSLLSICLLAMLIPAKGIALWTPAQLLNHLPDKAMRYFWANFDSFYAGSSPVLSLGTIDGVISFPSFHAAMGFNVLAMWRKSLLLGPLAAVWLVFMLLATMPYGGHYIVDLIAGLAVSGAWFALSRRLERRGMASKAAPSTCG